MELIIKPRGYGKTTDLVKIAATSKIPILAFNANMKKLYEMRCKELGIEPNKVKVILWDDIKKGKVIGEKINKVLIDEVLMFVEVVLNEYNLNLTLGTLSIDITPHTAYKKL